MSGERPKVLLVTGEYPPTPGGVGDYTALLRTYLQTADVDTAVLTTDGATGDGVHSASSWGRGIWNHTARLLRRERFDLLHIQYQAGAFDMRAAVNLLPWHVRRANGVPTITTFHDLRPPYLFPKAGGLRQRVLRVMARRSAAVIVTNPEDARAMSRWGIAPDMILIGPNIPPLDDQVPVERDTIGFFGLPGREKGIQELIVALGRVPPEQRPKLRLIGSAGVPSANNDVIAIEQLDGLALRYGVTLTQSGTLPAQAASDVLGRCGAIALPFRGGASLRSGSLLAALQSGRPVITTAPTCPDDLGPLRTLPQLTLVPPRDPAALATAIMRTMQADAMGEPQPLPACFDWTEIARQHLQLYTAVLGRGSR